MDKQKNVIKRNLRYADFDEVINLWPGRRIFDKEVAFADDLDVPAGTVVCWKRRNKVPAVYWLQILGAARVRKIVLTANDLVGLAALWDRKVKP